MILKPILPIWLMTVICILLIILIIYDKKLKDIFTNKNGLIKKYILSMIIKSIIIILLFIINLRPMIPNGEAIIMTANVNILFVIDTSISMRALDYNGNKERFEGVVNDCCNIVNELSNCKFSIITFGDIAQRIIPFTTDTDMVQAELKAISLEDEFYAKGTSLNMVNDILLETLKKEKERQKDDAKFIMFFVSDGEITKEGENLEAFSNIEKYVNDGAVLGYGTTEGGKMINTTYEADPTSDFYYLYYYEEFDKVTAISKIDEGNLKKIASDIKIDYIKMDANTNLNDKLNDIKKQISNLQTNEGKINLYKDIYYYFAIPLAVLLIIEFALKKRRM